MNDNELRQFLASIYTNLESTAAILLKTSALAAATKRTLEFDPVWAKRYAEYYEAELQSPSAVLQRKTIETLRAVAQRMTNG